MDQADYINRRKAKYMAQTLEAFEQQIEPLIPAASAGAVQDFKALVRARMTALANDACDAINLVDTAVNGAALDIRDQLSPVGRP